MKRGLERGDIGVFTLPFGPPDIDPTPWRPCPICGRDITPDDVRTVSVMAIDAPADTRASLFYRLHRTCANDAAPGTLAELDSQAITFGNTLASDIRRIRVGT